MNTQPNNKHAQLKREVGVFGAMMLGLGSIVGTGVFVSIALGVNTSGPAALLAIAVAAFVATCNGLSSAQLAAAHPVSGGTYEYGYQYLNPTVGFTAGWMFLLAKSASAATAALGFSYYLEGLFNIALPTHIVGTSLITLIILTIIVLSGLRRSSLVNTIIVSITLIALASFIFAGLSTANANAAENFTPFFHASADHSATYNFLQTAALMFVAYTGYGRIATLGEEIHDPRKNIPIAVILTLIVSMILYMGVAYVGIGAVGATIFGGAFEQSNAPLVEVAQLLDMPTLRIILSIGALTAMLGVLLNLILGLSRVLLAMGRRGDMPAATAKLNPTGTTPTVAVIVMATVIGILICVGDVKTTWSFSAFTVLIYYALTNLAALKLPKEDKRFPIIFPILGLASCVFLAFWIDYLIMAAGIACLIVGFILRTIIRSISKPAT